jgi:hypothetical protein
MFLQYNINAAANQCFQTSTGFTSSSAFRLQLSLQKSQKIIKTCFSPRTHYGKEKYATAALPNQPPCFLLQSNSQLPLNILTSLVQAPARFEQRALQPLCFEIPVRGTCLSIAALRFEGHFSNQPVETQIKFIAWIGFIILTGRKLMKNCG